MNHLLCHPAGMGWVQGNLLFAETASTPVSPEKANQRDSLMFTSFGGSHVKASCPVMATMAATIPLVW